MMLGKQMITAAIILGAFAIAGTALVGLTFETTKDKIAANERESLLKSLHELVPTSDIDNDMVSDVITVIDQASLGSDEAVNVYRARKDGQPVAAVIASQAPDGYSGTIKLLIAIRHNGELVGVRVISHKETPGLGDAIETRRSDWIHSFQGKTLNKPDKRGWAVKKDGGVFDQFTGATITPRAIVKATHNTLQYFERNRDKLFAPDKSHTESKDNG